MKKLATALAFALTVVMVGIGAANAAAVQYGPELIGNGGFESALADWTTSDFFAEGYDYGIDGDAHSGDNAFYGGGVGAPGYLSQAFATAAGVRYAVRLWVASDGFLPNELQVLWNGVELVDQVDILTQDYAEITVDGIAQATLSTLEIGVRDDAGFLRLDDVSVRAIPEPSPWALLALGLVSGLCVVKRRGSMASRRRFGVVRHR